MDLSLEVWTKVTSTILFWYFSFAKISFILFYGILKKPLWYRKIQKKVPKLTDYKRDIFWSLITITIFTTVIVFTFYKYNHLTNTYKDIEEYGYLYLFLSFFWMLFVHDTWFYWEDGKAEFYKAIILLDKNYEKQDKQSACDLLKISLSKDFKASREVLKRYCL